MKYLNSACYVMVIAGIACGMSCSRQVGYVHRPTDEITKLGGGVTSKKLEPFRIKSVLFVPSVGGDEMSGDGVIRFHLDLFAPKPESVELISIEVKETEGSAGRWLVGLNKIFLISKKDPKGRGFTAHLILLDNFPVSQRKMMNSESFVVLITAKVDSEIRSLKFVINNDTKNVL